MSIDNFTDKNLSTLAEIENISLNFNKISKEYDDLVKSNNTSNLTKEKENAKANLRYHYIKLELDNFKEEIKLNEIKI